MINRAAILLLLSAALATSGCCGWVHRPFGPGTLCDTTHRGGPACGHGCGPACDSGCEPCGAPCGPVCDEPCGSGCGTACGDPGCGSCRTPFGYRHPLLASILHPFRGASCSGCGELYLGGFHSDPPDCCDPCDHCGNFTGGGPSFGGYAHGGPAFGGYAGGGSPRATHCSTCGNGSAGAWGGEGNVSYGTPHATTQTGYMVEGQPGPFGGPQARAPQGTMPLR